MALGLNRRRIFVKGLGTFDIRETDPSAGTAFQSVGFLKSAVLNDEATLAEEIADTGVLVDTPTQSRKVTGVVTLLQTSKEEIDLVVGSSAKLYAARYSGLAGTGYWQYYSFPVCRFVPSINLPFQSGERTVALGFAALHQLELSYHVPEYYMAERGAEIDLDGLQLWVAAKEELTRGTVKLLDISGWERHGTIGSSFASVWQMSATPYFLRFDNNANYVCSFGDILDDETTTDFAIEAWVKFPTGGSQEEIVCKKNLVTDDNAGWALHKKADDTIAFKLADGDSNVTAVSTATVTTTWKHVAAVVDRSGATIQMYINGVVNGSAAGPAATTTGTNGEALKIGSDGTNPGKVDVGDVKIRKWASNGLPSTIATIISNDYAAERAYYGV